MSTANHGDGEFWLFICPLDVYKRQGMICLNGAAARCVSTGDKIIIMAYGQYTPDEAKEHKPAFVFVDEENKVNRVTNYERHGLLKDME